MGSPKPLPAVAPPPTIPREDPSAALRASEASRVARRKRSSTAGYGSTILTGGLGVLDQAQTMSNVLG